MENELDQEQTNKGEPKAINESGLDVAVSGGREKPISNEIINPPKMIRTIFRFKGSQDVALDLGKFYKIFYEGKQVVLQISPDKEALNEKVDFDSEEAAYTGYEQIIGAWARGA